MGGNQKTIKAIRSFNLSTDAIDKLNQGAEREGVSRSAYVERLIVTENHKRRVKADIAAGVQTTLNNQPTEPKPLIQAHVRCRHCPSMLSDHLRWENGRWTVTCTNAKVGSQ